MGEFVNIVVRTLDSSEIALAIFSSAKIHEIKYFLNLRSGIPVERQRLLYKGKLLKNEESLEDAGIGDLDHLFLVGNIQREPDAYTMLAQLSLLNALESYRRTRSQRIELTNEQLREALRQNSYIIEDVLTNSLFHSSYRNLRVGQWVDVLDTVNQWLEAQVIQLRASSSQIEALIHYNGWPDVWDEWISIDSPRIMPFRSKTNQSLGMAVQSPFPRNSPINPRSGTEELSIIMMKASCYIANVKETLLKYSLLNQALKSFGEIGGLLGMPHAFERHESQLKSEVQHIRTFSTPVFDRVGRMMTDLGQALARNEDLNVNLIKLEERI
ncbi:unnamed protein product [Blepharisma stoltei]|uniref:Ubiquitin-like domain-containing protein n=1 Tax=Blepharisma stoltei TaxID=1481888 RepID=A0AAU9JVF5_9CILI|nr:unnamed protein product [Blepharisma stoltei]